MTRFFRLGVWGGTLSLGLGIAASQGFSQGPSQGPATQQRGAIGGPGNPASGQPVYRQANNGPGSGPVNGPVGGPASPAGGAAQPVAAPVKPQAPEWIPLSPDHEKYLNSILLYWQQSSDKVERYRCRFNRWSYDPTFVARDPVTKELPAKMISTGMLMYAKPDKGLFREDRVEHYVAPRMPGEKPRWQASPEEKGDHWVCDGKSTFLFDHANKRLVQVPLPPGMRGKAIVDGPLPFLFGAEAAKIKERFWVRVTTPPGMKGEYHLEAVPKRQEDAANFRSIRVIIDEADFLPKAMALYDRNNAYQTFAFPANDGKNGGREVNWPMPLAEKLNPFSKEFYEPATPSGYTKFVERFEDAGAPGPAGQPGQQPSPQFGQPQQMAAPVPGPAAPRTR